ncbi:MAG: XdhC family protein [Saprospiraceae bacterium]|nr:XdhC family protein [Saprospiraceae bacterium]
MVLDFYHKLLPELVQAESIVLMVVIRSEGSSPGRMGFLMAVSLHKTIGTIGGGIMEHKLVELSKVLLQKGPFQPFIKHQIHQSSSGKNKSGMICSGNQTVGLYYLDKSYISVIEKILSQKVSHIQYTENKINIISNKDIVLNSVIENDQKWTLMQPIGSQNKVYIVGGGHVSLALSEVLSKLDFEIHLLDHRDGLNTFEMNKFAYSKKIIDLNECQKYIHAGENIFVVIVSFGYRTDKVILKSLLSSQYRYIGMMGSKKKTEVLMAELRDEGHSDAVLEKVFAPIGIDIKSETTYEIAISIAAQLIKVKNSPKVRNGF